MSGTAQTIASLYTTYADAGTPFRLTPAQMRNVVATVDKRSDTYNITNPEWGAIGDGASHPLSGVTLFQGMNTTGWTLGQWQAKFPGATATTNELNWCAFQLAINTAYGGGTGAGGAIHVMAALFRMTNTNSAADGSGMLTFPVVDKSGGATQLGSVGMYGDGWQASILWWPNDLGAGDFAVTCANRLTTSISTGFLENMQFVGPNNSVAIGANPANMNGMGWAQWMRMKQVRLVGFKNGVCIPGGEQTMFVEVDTYNCYYGYYWDAPNVPQAFSDCLFLKCEMAINKMAAIGVANTLPLTNMAFIKCFLGTAPYSIFKETGVPGAGINNVMLEDCKFLHCQFEGIGNAIFSDGLAAGAHRCYFTGQVDLEFCEIGDFNAAYNLAANPKTGVFCCLQNPGYFSVRNPVVIGNAGLASYGFTNGLFEFDFFSNMYLEADLDTLFSQMTGVPIGRTTACQDGGLELKNNGSYPWRGRVYRANGNPTLVKGNVVALDSSGVGLVGLSAGTTTEQIAGIVAHPHTAAAGLVCVIQQGFAGTVRSGTVALTNGHIVRAGATGLAVDSNTNFPTASKNIGVWSNASGASPNFVGGVYLQGLV